MSYQNRNINIQDIKIKEIQIFFELSSINSIRELARRRSVQPGQISKTINSLEKKLGVILFERSIGGVNLTPSAKEMIPILQKIYDACYEIQDLENHKKEIFQKKITIASTSFLTSEIITQMISSQKIIKKGIGFSLLDLAPSEFVQAGLLGGIQLCFHIGKIDWPRTWTSKKVCSLEWKLYCRKDHPILKSPTTKNVIQYPFVYPIYWTKGGIQRGNDLCPIPVRHRMVRAETTTAASALQIVKSTNSLAFLPDIFKRSIHSDTRTVTIKDIKKVVKPIYATVKSDLMTKNDYEDLIQEFNKQLP